MRKSLPKNGQKWEALNGILTDMTAGDADWRCGRVPRSVNYATDSVYNVSKKAFVKFLMQHSNAFIYPGIARMEKEVVEMALSLLHAPEDGCGNMTTGGSESILLAMKACRDFNRANRRRGVKPNIVVPYSAHPAFNKAAMVMDIKVRRVPLGNDLRADWEAMAATVDDRTMMIVGSVPTYPHGVIDSIPDLSRLAIDRDLWLHVDACGGGYIAPFAKQLGLPIPDFDFSLPGVRSISADLHKFGYCPKPASTVLYRNADDYSYQQFEFDEWPTGPFITPNLTNTRPGGAVAAAWAVMHHLGEEGYLEVTERLLNSVRAYKEGINAIDSLKVWGEPDLSIFTFGSDEMDIFAVAERLTGKGWLVGLNREPRGIHFTMSMIHQPVREEYLADLAVAVADVKAGRGESKNMTAFY
jgi:sphinganine-1-phosphate aldolase